MTSDLHNTIDIQAVLMTTDLHDTQELLHCQYGPAIADAIDNASDQDRATVLTEHGKPVAAIVPIDVLESYERLLLPRPVSSDPERYWNGVVPEREGNLPQ